MKTLPRYSKNTARASELLDALAWSVRHEVPLAKALRSFFSLRGVSRVFRYVGILFGCFFSLPMLLWLAPLLVLLWMVGLESGAYLRDLAVYSILLIPLAFLLPVSRIGWNWRVNNLALDLRSGKSLQESMRRNVGLYFPGYVLGAIGVAEKRGTLDTALPHLASQLQRTRAIHQRRGVPIAVVLGKVLMCIMMFYFTAIFIYPKMQEVVADAKIPDAAVIGPVLEFLFSWLVPILLGLFVVLVLLSLFPGIRRRVFFVRGDYSRVFLCDTACSMAHHLRQGDTLVAAAEHTLAGCRTSWQRKHLQPFYDAVAAGEPWNEAWNRMNLGGPLDAWFADVAASREDPAEGFENMVEWAEHDIGYRTAWILRWLDPIVSVILGVWIFWFAKAMLLKPLVLFVEHLTRSMF